MVGALKRYTRDPDGKGRGGGLYYHRGNDEHSKYSFSKDAKHKLKKKGSRTHGDKVGSGSYKHTHDRR